jgi:hypothetical protein
LTPLGNGRMAYDIKILHFAPYLREITIDLSK